MGLSEKDSPTFVLLESFLYNRVAMLDKIYNILVTIMGPSKQGYFDSSVFQYQFNCPYCADEKGGVDGKYNMECNLAMGKYHCWACGEAGNLSRLIKDRGGKELLEEYYRAVKELKESKFFEIGLFKDDGQTHYGEEYIRLPQTFTKIDLSTCKKKKLVNYLNKRHITQDIIDFYNIGYTTWDEKSWQLRDRIIIPSYDINGDLNYWIGRDFSGYKPKMKYWNCRTNKNSIVLHEDKIKWDADIVLVEGALDCIYYANSIALMGKALTKDCELYYQLYEKANGKVIICLDADTTIEEKKRIYKTLNAGRLKGRVWYIDLDEEYGKDFGEIYEKYGKQGIINTIAGAKQFSEIDLMF